LTLCRLKP